MITLANGCMPPESPSWKMPCLGEQTYDWGYHGGRKRSRHGSHRSLRPYDPNEIALIQRFCALADREFEAESKKAR